MPPVEGFLALPDLVALLQSEMGRRTGLGERGLKRDSPGKPAQGSGLGRAGGAGKYEVGALVGFAQEPGEERDGVRNRGRASSRSGRCFLARP